MQLHLCLASTASFLPEKIPLLRSRLPDFDLFVKEDVNELYTRLVVPWVVPKAAHRIVHFMFISKRRVDKGGNLQNVLNQCSSCY